MAQSVGILGKVTGSLVQVKTYRLMYNWAFEVKVTGRAFFFFFNGFCYRSSTWQIEKAAMNSVVIHHYILMNILDVASKELGFRNTC